MSRQNWEFEELSQGFQLARARVRDSLLSAAESAKGDGIVGVEMSHTIGEEELEHRAKMPTGQSRGWQRGSLGLPHYVSGAGESSRSGYLITMHGAGTAILAGARHSIARTPNVAENAALRAQRPL